ncbi:hypothetical protein PVAND_000816 [Polypedilum vanderplanki]|uniref:MAD2L1-binding protein n=1 Tax=Polypedilum vanderplanki TaxID=319348 RepID=A0A9J6BLB7_POLVA|nr:hypothetical protein PVAND_000816 [Polypedilum vanderplanki]
MEINPIDIDLDFKPTKQFLIKLIQSILLYLLHERTQIPFSFDVFERFLKNKKFDGETKCYKTKNQIKIAQETYEKICSLKEIIKNEFSYSKTFVFIFGSHLTTAKECYEINLPFMNNNNVEVKYNETTTLRNVLLQIITNDRLKISNHLPITNCFLLLNRHKPTTDNVELSQIREFRLNKNCKKFTLNIRDASKFVIFQESESVQDPPKDEEKLNQVLIDPAIDNWYQSRVYVKGFNDTLVNSKSIWN